MISTFAAPASARSGRGHAGLDSSVVRPITPENAVPGSYSFSGMIEVSHRVERSWPVQDMNGVLDDGSWAAGRALIVTFCEEGADHPSWMISRSGQTTYRGRMRPMGKAAD